MDQQTLANLAAIAQVAATVILLIGTICSMWLSVKALREVQTDRKLRQQPHLLFDSMGLRIATEFVKAGKAIPGINPQFAAKAFPNMPEDAESVRLRHTRTKDGRNSSPFYAHLRNYGAGPAINAEVVWVPETIWFGSERIELDSNKLKEPQYSSGLNTLPLWPSHILPAQEAKLTRLPTFIEKDYEKKISKVEGYFLIRCNDVSDTKSEVKQGFYIFTNYTKKDNGPWVHVTFRDPI